MRARPLAQQAAAKPNQSAQAVPRANADNPVVVFLKECGLQMYAARFLQNGFDEMETLHAIEEADLKELGLPPFHVSRLQKSLRELRQKEGGDQQANARSIVMAFLEECGLGKYSSVLLSSGFEEMETLLDIDDIDLKDLGFPRGHALKLKRHLREYETNLYAEEAQQSVARAFNFCSGEGCDQLVACIATESCIGAKGRAGFGGAGRGLHRLFASQVQQPLAVPAQCGGRHHVASERSTLGAGSRRWCFSVRGLQLDGLARRHIAAGWPSAVP